MESDPRQLLRKLPALDALLKMPASKTLADHFGQTLTTQGLRSTLEQQRSAILAGKANGIDPATFIDKARTWLQELVAPTLKPVINGTGVIVHTNIGRSPLSEKAIVAMTKIAAGYSNLEYDENAGKRGSRSLHAEKLLNQITQAEAAFVTNNNAAAVLLMLSALCKGREVIISRGQLVEIGGGFRIPDVMAQSGCQLVEVGTTNRTHLRDYEAAINENTAAIMVAHHSNYRIVGFTTEPSLADLAALAHSHNIPLLYDQGSGAFLDTSLYGLKPEPTVLDGLAAGADVVCFSGDKLLGGPQAGILAGRGDLVGQCKRHPLARAVRPDKLCLAALAATLVPYVKGTTLAEIPIWRMISRPLADIEKQATEWVDELRNAGIKASLISGKSTVGGGSLPGTSMPTKLVAIAGIKPDLIAAKLRANPTPIITRIAENQLLVDPRTILPNQEKLLLQSLIFNTSTTDAASTLSTSLQSPTPKS